MFRYASLLILAGLICYVAAAEISLSSNEYSSEVGIHTSTQIENLPISSNPSDMSWEAPSDDEIIDFYATGGDSTQYSYNKPIKFRNVRDFFRTRLDLNNPYIEAKALEIAPNYNGNLTIDVVRSIYRYLKMGNSSVDGWKYISDPRIKNYFSYANETFRLGEKSGCSGIGDCNDFAIAVSSLIEALGGTSRIVLAQYGSIGHAYAEIYLGNINVDDDHIIDSIDMMKYNYNIYKIHYSVEDRGDVWLNLDWTASDPGGPYCPADKRRIIINFSANKKGICSQFDKASEKSVYDNAIGDNHLDLKSMNESISSKDSQDPQAWINEGIRYNYLPDYNKAILCFNTALNLSNQSNAQAWNDKGYALDHLNIYDMALYCFDQAINCSRNYNYSKPWYNKGRSLYFYYGKYDESIICCEKAIELNPKDADAWYVKSLALDALGKHDDAKLAYDRANAIDPITYF